MTHQFVHIIGLNPIKSDLTFHESLGRHAYEMVGDGTGGVGAFPVVVAVIAAIGAYCYYGLYH